MFVFLKKSLSKEYSINDSSSHLSLTNNNAGRICMRVLYDSNTHVLTISLIQSNKLLGSDKIKLFSKVQFQITLTNREKAPKYKTTTKEYNEILNFNENFYFPNIEKGKHFQQHYIYKLLIIYIDLNIKKKQTIYPTIQY